jgi:hypothetical protein
VRGKGITLAAWLPSRLLDSLDEPMFVLLLQAHVVLEEAFRVVIETLRDPVSNLSDLLDHGITG